MFTGGHTPRLDGVLRGEGPFFAKRFLTIDVGVALSLTGVAGPVGVRGRWGGATRSS